METEKQIIHIQYYNSPCGEIILASVDNELCLCDWNKMPSAPRNMHRITQHINAVFKIETSPINIKFGTHYTTFPMEKQGVTKI